MRPVNRGVFAANDDDPGVAIARRLIRVLAVLTTLALVLFAVFFAQVAAAVERSAKAKRDFRAEHPCPATHKTKGACPGYVIDHVKPLCAGGPDHPSNMAWQTVADAKIKDREERKMCGHSASTVASRAESPKVRNVAASKSSAKDGGCGSRGGPGYRLPSGRCASWHDD